MYRLRRADGARRLLPAAGDCARPAALVDAAARMNVLEVRNLSVRLGGMLAIESLDLEVREGEVLSLIGPNGAGKTTAFNAITGYLAPAAGEIVFLGKRINGRKASEIAALGLVRTFQKT